MYNSVAAVRSDLEASGVAVVDCPLRENQCLSLADGALIAVDTARFATRQEEATALIHEEGHFTSGAFYVPYRQNTGQTRPPRSNAFPCASWWSKCARAGTCGRLPSAST